MKAFVILFFLTCLNQISAQYNYYDSCEEAKAHAIKDAQSGILMSRGHGLPDVPTDWNPDFENYFEIYIYSKYGIEITQEGCVITDYEECYTQTMDSVIISKFGNDIFEKNRNILKQKFSYSTNEDRISILDFSRLYKRNLESLPKFVGNDVLVSNYLNTIIESKKESLFNSVLLVVEKNGKIIDFTIEMDLQMKTSISKKDIIKKLNSLGNWVPGYIYGQKVKSQADFYIH